MSTAGKAADPRVRWAKPRPEGRVSARTGEPARHISHLDQRQRGSRSARRRAIARGRRSTVRLSAGSTEDA